MVDSSEIITNVMERRITKLLVQDKRLDGRGLTDYREIKVETGLIEKADGSALVSLGNTKVLVGIKVDVGEPYPDTPDEGVQTVNAELVPLASPVFEPGPPKEDAIELARVVDRGIRESKAIDVKKLCIIPGKKVYIVFIDVYVLDHDGNMIDASAMASIVALAVSKIPVYEVNKNGELEITTKKKSLPLKDYPIAVTIAKIEDSFLVDPSLEEENMMDTRLTISLNNNNDICAMQKGGIGTLKKNEILDATAIARKKAKEIRKILKGK